MMYGQGKSDSPIVPMKSPNNAAPAAAEAMEGRGGAKGNAVRGSELSRILGDEVDQAAL
jgi:hypothetical protein